MSIFLIDTHCHLDAKAFDTDRMVILNNSRAAGVKAIILPGICKPLWENLLFLSKEEKDLYPALGLHPMFMEMHQEEDLVELSYHAHHSGLKAIGEIGLDYFVTNENQRQQQELFERQIDIAEENGLPILLHVRKAHDQVLSTLRRKHFSHRGIVHSFSGSLQQAEQYISLGFLIGVGGNITYNRSRKLRKTLQTLPLTTFVLETDAPDLPPSPYHGKRNCPEYLPIILETLAELREESKKQLALATTKNATTLFKIKL